MTVTQDVGIGIVTALPVEFAAARLLLIEAAEAKSVRGFGRYMTGHLPSANDDHRHRVALTMLADDGTRNAAAATSSLLTEFPRIRSVVMVGIAGGVPAVDAPQRHVRRGDVVVATGLVDYGHLRSVDGSPTIRRWLDRPGAELVTAERSLQADEWIGERPWEEWLDGRRSVPPIFARPPEYTDILTIGGMQVRHPDDTRYGRRPGYPKIHRGVVGSADRLLRDEHLRDELAQEHGVCAIEMEGAGIATASALRATPWFMVRGIVDYCDNATKDDAWHAYAALAAAAYTRTVLAQVSAVAPPPDVTKSLEDLRRIVDSLLNVLEVRDAVSRRMLVELLPPNIRMVIHDGGSARQHVLSIVRTCQAYPEGQSALLDALRAVVPTGSVALESAENAIHQHWSYLGY